MKKRVCITGVGVVTPSGIGNNQFWDNVSNGNVSIAKITRFPCENLPIQVAGEIKNFDVSNFVSKRLAIKTDRFTHYALAAAKMALEDAKLDLSNLDPYKVGVWLGNNAGGWDICERGLYELYRDGAEFVNPWQATAWFLSSPQGYVTIANNIKGMSKSFVCDRASGASAIYFAARAIQAGYNDVILAGGTEAPITAFAMTCYYETGELVASIDDITLYRPFDKSRQGLILGEGSTVLILEEFEHAVRRQAPIYGEIISGAIATDFNPADHQRFLQIQKKVMMDANLNAMDIDVVFAEGAATKESDNAEANALVAAFAKNKQIPVTCPKSGFGHLYGASTATDIACGLFAAKHELIPPTPNFYSTDDNIQLNIVTTPQKKHIKNFLVNSRAREGSSVSLIVTTDVKH